MRYKVTSSRGSPSVTSPARGPAALDTTRSCVMRARSPGTRRLQQATSTIQAKATELTKTAAAKAPDYAKNAAANAAKAASTQVPKLVSTAKQATQAATDKIPARFGGTGGVGATDAGDVAPDGNLVYPADGSPSVNGTHYTPDMP